MARLTKPIEEQIAEVQGYFDNVWINQDKFRTKIFWLPKAEGKTYWIEITIEHDLPPPYAPLKGKTAVKCQMFFRELCLLSDTDFYHLPHIWLPEVYAEVDRFYYWKKYQESAPFLYRGMPTICPYDPNYIEENGIDLFEIMKLVASYLTMFEYWRCGFGWQGGGIPHKKDAKVEVILGKALRRHRLSSASPTALDFNSALQDPLH